MSEVRHSWEIAAGTVVLKDGAYYLVPAGKSWMPPILLPANAAVLCDLPNEAILMGHAQVPCREALPPCCSCGGPADLLFEYHTEPFCAQCVRVFQDGLLKAQVRPPLFVANRDWPCTGFCLTSFRPRVRPEKRRWHWPEEYP